MYFCAQKVESISKDDLSESPEPLLGRTSMPGSDMDSQNLMCTCSGYCINRYAAAAT